MKKSRSYGRFDEQRPIDRETLIGLVDIARFCPSARNRQPLRYVVSTDPEKTVRIRDCLLFALDLPDWGRPVVGERPVAYIILAFGYPAEQVVLEEVDSYGRTNYWRDSAGVHYVPKRLLSEVLIQADP